MSLKIRFKFDGRCRLHPRYNPEADGQPKHPDCPGCDALWVIRLYTHIARRKAETGEGILVCARPAQPELPESSEELGEGLDEARAPTGKEHL